MARDGELLCAWCAGDRAAGNALIGAHFAAVCRFFRTKLGDDVEDLVQQTFLDLLAASSSVTSVRATRFTIARRRHDPVRARLAAAHAARAAVCCRRERTKSQIARGLLRPKRREEDRQ